MKRTLKFTITPGHATIVPITKSSRVIHVAEQHSYVAFWVEVNLGDFRDESVRRTFKLVATGEVIPDEPATKYCGSAVCEDGNLVWHLYEVLGS